MRIITVSIELVIDDTVDILNDSNWASDCASDLYDKTKIANYLNDKLYSDHEWFGDFGPENIINIKEIE